MPKLARPEAIIGLEGSLYDKLSKGTTQRVIRIAVQIGNHLARGEFDAAEAVIADLSLLGDFQKKKKQVQLYGMSALVLGAKYMAYDEDVVSIDRKRPPDILERSIEHMDGVFRDMDATYTRIILEKVQALFPDLSAVQDLLQKADEEIKLFGQTIEIDQVDSKIIERKVKQETRALVQGQKDQMVRLASSLYSTRMAAYGGLLEGETRGYEYYKLNEQLDARICPICEHMHGQIFEVSEAKERATHVLTLTDAEAIKAYAPWPRQDKASVAAFVQLTTNDLRRAGYMTPPFHPFCRGLVFPGHAIITGTPRFGVDDTGEHVCYCPEIKIVQKQEPIAKADPCACPISQVYIAHRTKASFNKWAKKHTGDLELSDDEWYALDAYSDYDQADNINKHLRSGGAKFKAASKRARTLDEVMQREQCVTDDNYVFYRSTEDFPEVEKFKPGYVFQEKGFTSMTGTEKMAKDVFAELEDDGSIYEIRVPKGARVLATDYNLGDDYLYQEAILGKNAKFRVVEVKDVKVAGYDTRRIVLQLEEQQHSGKLTAVAPPPPPAATKPKAVKPSVKPTAKPEGKKPAKTFGTKPPKKPAAPPKPAPKPEPTPEPVTGKFNRYEKMPSYKAFAEKNLGKLGLDDHEAEVIVSYIDGSGRFNNTMRKGAYKPKAVVRTTTGEVKDDIAVLADLFEDENAILDRNIITHRVANDKGVLASLKEGQVLRDKAFMSTSTSKNYVEEFTEHIPESVGLVFFNIEVPKGSRAIPISAANPSYLSEMEVLLAPGSQLKITKVRKELADVSEWDRPTTYVTARVMPATSKPKGRKYKVTQEATAAQVKGSFKFTAAKDAAPPASGDYRSMAEMVYHRFDQGMHPGTGKMGVALVKSKTRMAAVNKHLRGDKTVGAADDVARMEKIFKAASTDINRSAKSAKGKPIIGYRLMALDDKVKRLKVGSSLRDNAYVNVVGKAQGLNKAAAALAKTGETPVLIQMKMKPNTKVLPMRRYGGDGANMEFLLNKRSGFKVEAIEEITGPGGVSTKMITVTN